jgi:general secretion pathway protein A
MYTQAFGLHKEPFNLTPDPGFLYLTAQHREALVGLTHSILQRKGFIVLTGEAGTGKTTLLARVLQFLPSSKLQFSAVVNPTLTPDEFLELALLDFGIEDISGSKAQRLWRLEKFILQGEREGKVSALIVDEAHKLSPEVLEEIRLLGNIEDAEHKLLQILLVGQTELDSILDLDSLRQLKQRIMVRLAIGPLAAGDVERYIRHRWVHAGGKQPPFSKGALDTIAARTGGIPRLINSLCENAVMQALASGSEVAHRDHVETAAAHLHLDEAVGKASRPGADELFEQQEGVPELDDFAADSEKQPSFEKTPQWTRWANRLGFGARRETGT